LQRNLCPTSSGNILVKSVSFYLERFQRYDVLKMYNFLGHPVYSVPHPKRLSEFLGVAEWQARAAVIVPSCVLAKCAGNVHSTYSSWATRPAHVVVSLMTSMACDDGACRLATLMILYHRQCYYISPLYITYYWLPGTCKASHTLTSIDVSAGVPRASTRVNRQLRAVTVKHVN